MKYKIILILCGFLLSCSEHSLKKTWYENVNFKGNPQSAPFVDTEFQMSSITYPLLLSTNDTINIWPIPEKYDYDLFENGEYDSTKTFSLELRAFENLKFIGKFWSYLSLFDDNDKQPEYDSVSKTLILIKNLASSFSILELHDSKLLVIQEAKTKNGDWRPIEHFSYSGCGNSVHFIKIPKNGILLFGVNKYTGNFKTKMRVKLKNGPKIFYSNEFKGTINEKLFNEPEIHGFGYNRYFDQ